MHEAKSRTVIRINKKKGIFGPDFTSLRRGAFLFYLSLLLSSDNAGSKNRKCLQRGPRSPDLNRFLERTDNLPMANHNFTTLVQNVAIPSRSSRS